MGDALCVKVGAECMSSSCKAANACCLALRGQRSANSSFCFRKSLSTCAPLLPLRISHHPPQISLKVKAVVGYPASMAWWKKGNLPNMRDINSAQEFVDAISKAGENLVLVDFYSTGCRSCKALHPKICQIAEDNPDIEVLKVNFHENNALCRSLNVNILPFFHFYRGQDGRVDAFSCSLTKINKLRAAVAKHKGGHVALPAPGPVLPVANRKDLLARPSSALAVAVSLS
ncbi:hypothetical protein L7F22_034151 [Adiantum nelumboides]|nr:hypothetical protein [Adiantum nelumboides]